MLVISMFYGIIVLMFYCDNQNVIQRHLEDCDGSSNRQR